MNGDGCQTSQRLYLLSELLSRGPMKARLRAERPAADNQHSQRWRPRLMNPGTTQLGFSLFLRLQPDSRPSMTPRAWVKAYVLGFYQHRRRRPHVLAADAAVAN